MKVKFQKVPEHRKSVRSCLPVTSDAHHRFEGITPGIHFYPSFDQSIHLPVKEIRTLEMNRELENIFFDLPSTTQQMYFRRSTESSAGILFRCLDQPLNLSLSSTRFHDLFGPSDDFLAWANEDTIIASDWVHYPSQLDICVNLLRQVYEALGKIFPPMLDIEEIFDINTEVFFGADPEFEFLDNGWVTSGSSIIQSSQYGRIGLDAAGDQLEVRPDPCADPVELYRRIKALAIEAEKTYNHRISLAGHSYPIGCHIHVGPSVQETAIAENDVPQLINQIDNALGELVELSGRARYGYKERRAYECKEHGGFEYRSLPSCVLVTEKLFVAVMNTLKATLFEEPIPSLPEDELKRLTILVASGVPFSFDYEVIVPQFTYQEGDAYSVEFEMLLKAKTQELAKEGLLLCSGFSLFGFGAIRGMVTNIRLLADRMGWKCLEWSTGKIGLPYKIRTQLTGRELKKFFATFFAVLVELGYFRGENVHHNDRQTVSERFASFRNPESGWSWRGSPA